MKIAVTADLHLTSRGANPERFNHLEQLLDDLIDARINTLIVAGDLFHESSRNYSDFEKVCRDAKYRQIYFHVIPGNHDVKLDAKSMAAENVTIYSEPTIHQFDLMSQPILFLPYQKEKSMGDVIAVFRPSLEPQGWILVSHGDWVEGVRTGNPMEPGIYMPLTRPDVELFQPTRVILGHIHKPTDRGIVHYPGSPFPLDITETGRRRIQLIDLETGQVESRDANPDCIYFDESLLILPVEDEEAYIQTQIQSRLSAWSLSETEKGKVRLRIKVRGYSADKKQLAVILKDSLQDFSFYKGAEPDIDEVFLADDIERAEIARRVRSSIDELSWSESEDEPTREDILLQALHVIYGDG